SCFDEAEMLPCAGQGALGIETRADSDALNADLATLGHGRTRLAVEAERAVSRTLGGSCSMPLAAHARWHGSSLVLRAAVGHPLRADQPLLRASGEAAVDDDAGARSLGSTVAATLLDLGAAAYLAAASAA
ncbi:MAG: hydroxymethylbilane synthase, partial [Caldimonas sp.]